MKFILYNIRYGTGGKMVRKLFLPYITGYMSNTINHVKEISKFLKEENPDIVGLVEVDLGSVRHSYLNQVEVLAKELNHYNSHEVKYNNVSKFNKFPVLRKQGNAILYNEEFKGIKFHHFEQGTKTLIIELEMEKVVIFVVHLALGRKIRFKQINQLYKLIKSQTKEVIVGGDFNLMWGEEEIELFLEASGLINPNKEKLATFPSWKPKKHLDFILHSKNIKINEFRVEKIELSDHLPLILDFDVVS